MRNIKCFVIPVTIRASRIVTKGKKGSANNNRKAFNRFPKRSCTRDIARNNGIATI
jgi:ribosomal protein L17